MSCTVWKSVNGTYSFAHTMGVLAEKVWAGYLLDYTETISRHQHRVAVCIERRAGLQDGLGVDLKSLFKLELLYERGFHFFQGKAHINHILSINSIQQDLFIVLQSVTDLTRKACMPRNAYYLGWRDILQASSSGPSFGPSSVSIII